MNRNATPSLIYMMLLFFICPLSGMDSQSTLEHKYCAEHPKFNALLLTGAVCINDTDLVYRVIRSQLHENNLLQCPYCKKKLISFSNKKTPDELHTSNIQKHLNGCEITQDIHGDICEFPETIGKWKKITINTKKVKRKKRKSPSKPSPEQNHAPERITKKHKIPEMSQYHKDLYLNQYGSKIDPNAIYKKDNWGL